MPLTTLASLRCLAPFAALAALGLGAGSAAAQPSAWSCDGMGPLQGPAVSPLVLGLPTGARPVSEAWALLAYDEAPLTLPIQLVAADQGVLFLPLTLEPGQPETVGLTLVGIDAEGVATWGCTGLSLTVLPPPPMPDGRFRMARRAEELAGQADRITGPVDAQGAPVLAGMGDGLRALAQDLRGLTADPQALAHLDAVLGAFAAAMPVLPVQSPLRAAPPDAPFSQSKFFAATLAQTGLGTHLDVCPATPEQLTEYIDLGVRARINSDASQQFLLTTGLTLAGLSARLVNRAYGGSGTVDKAIDAAVTSVSTAQAVLSDYLAGMMPLNLDRLEVTHDPTFIADDTPVDSRVFRIHQVVLHTRSDGWSPDKAALDVMLAVATARTGGAAGQTTGRISGRLRGQADDLLAQTRLGHAHELDVRLAQRDLAAAERSASASRAVADTVAARHQRGALPDPSLLGSTQSHVDRSEEAFRVAYARAETLADETRRAADGARAAGQINTNAEIVDTFVNPGLGIVEGLGQGTATGHVGASEVGPIGRQVSTCRVDMTRGADGRVPPHLDIRVAENDTTVLHYNLNGVPGAPIAFDVVGSGSRTIDVSLNPRVDLFPLTRQDALPRHSIPVRVGQIQGRIDGLPPVVAPWSVHALQAQITEVMLDPPLIWEVEPPLPLTVTGGRGIYTAELTIPEDVPEGTLITVRIRADWDLISSARHPPVWSAVSVVREDPAECAPASSARLRSLPAGSLLAGDYHSIGSSQARAMALQPCPFVSSEFHPYDAAAGLFVGRDTEGVVAWGGNPVYRLDGIDAVQALFSARGVCSPATPWGSLRDWLAQGGGQDETYLLGDCSQILLLIPGQAMILERPFADTPTVEDWLFYHYQLN